MCNGGNPDSTLTINQGNPEVGHDAKGNTNVTTPQQRAAANAAFLARYGMKPNGQPLGTPDDAPDITDALLKQGDDSRTLKLLAQRGSKSTFVSGGGLGDASEEMLTMPKAKGK